MRRPPHLPAKILNAYTEALSGFSHVYVQTISATHCSLKAGALNTAPTVGTVGGMYILRTGLRMKTLNCLGLVPALPGGHILLMTSFSNSTEAVTVWGGKDWCSTSLETLSPLWN